MPVAAGIGFFALLFVFLWGIAVYISHNSAKTTSNLAPTVYEVGGTKTVASFIERGGPLILPDLLQANGTRSIVLDHTGTDPDQNWVIYMAYPADRSVSCKVELVKETRTFTDCDKRIISIEQLASPPDGVGPIAQNGKLTLDLRPD